MLTGNSVIAEVNELKNIYIAVNGTTKLNLK